VGGRRGVLYVGALCEVCLENHGKVWVEGRAFSTLVHFAKFAWRTMVRYGWRESEMQVSRQNE
jgi:hypothetical protein